DVVRVLPHVDREKRGLAVGQGQVGVGGAHDGELAAVGDEPAPAAAELTGAHVGELLLERVEGAEVALDRVGEVTARLTAATGLEAVPKEAVVPVLGCVVEQAAFGA